MGIKPLIKLMLALCTAPIFASSPSSLSFKGGILDQMDKMNMSMMAAAKIVKNGVKVKSRQQHNKIIYIDNMQEIGVIVDEESCEVINIVTKVNSHDLLIQQDLAAKKNKIRKSSASDI